MMVMFATTCDFCGARSEEYTAHPTCRECLQDCCEKCGTDYEENDGVEKITCPACITETK